ncbi:MAG: hypothetical protein ACXACR_17255 [Candidatus Hodarchaeales archaeon]
MKKISTKEVGIAIALTLAIAALSIFYNTAPESNSFRYSSAISGNELSSLKALYSFGSAERVQVMDANILGKLEKGKFETVVPSIEALTREKGGYIVTEQLTFENGLWSGEIVSKLPAPNASAFTIGIRQKIDEYGEVVRIQINIREYTVSQNMTGDEQYSTIKTLLSEKLGEGGTIEPVGQLFSALPILVTGLVWIGEGLIIGVPLCFISLGIVVLLKRVIIPLWKKELSKPL